MTPYIISGLVVGSIYAISALGLVLTYTSSRVFNFAHGAIGMVGAYVAWEVRYTVPSGATAGRPVVQNPVWLAWSAGILLAALIGALAHLLIMRPLRRASPLARIVATLGLLIVLQSAAVLRYGARTTAVQSTGTLAWPQKMSAASISAATRSCPASTSSASGAIDAIWS